MPQDPRVTAYIEKSPVFAQPVLREIRARMHAACPSLDEAIKWSMPFFVLDGAPIASMAAFKAHAAFGFWRREVAGEGKSDAMGQFGKLTSIADLPGAVDFAALVGKAIAIVNVGGRSVRTTSPAKPSLEVPADLRAALDAVPVAAAAFAGFPPSAQREYVEWALEAKQAATRERRIATTVAQCAEGKRRYWNMAGR